MRVLFTIQPGEGHLNPIVPLAHALTGAGHAVAVACAPGFCPAVAARGLQAFPAGIDWLVQTMGARWPVREMTDHQIWSTIFAGDTAESALPDLLAIAGDWRPDVIVRDMTEFGGWLAADALGIPHATLEVTLFAHYQQASAVVADALAAIRTRAGLPAVDVEARLFEHLCLSFVPPSLEDPEAPLPATAHALRPLLAEPAPGERAPDWLAARSDRPVVYATLGTLFNRIIPLFEAIIAGVGELDVDLLVTLGATNDPATFGPQPDNVHLARYISQALLLPHCDAVVSHGGFGTVIGALAHGLPQVILPIAADQHVNARRCAALGAAIVLEANPRAANAVRAATQTVLTDPSYRQNAARLRDEIAALPGPELAVTLLARLAGA